MKNFLQPEKREELKWLKENIDIRQYLESSGYTLDKSRNTRRYQAYFHEGRVDKIYVPMDNRYPVPSYYVNQYDKADKGSIIDFVMSREKKSLEEARLTLRDFQPPAGTAASQSLPSKRLQAKEQLLAEAADQQKRQRYVIEKVLKEGQLKDSSYLRSRFLEEETITARAFKGKVLQNDSPEGRLWVFPLQDQAGSRVEGISLKNADTERMLGRRSGLWISHPSKNLKAAVAQLVITESPIDAMSYYQLNKARMAKENTVLVSSAGNPGQEQLKGLREYILQQKVSRVVLASDQDKAGEQYNKVYQQLIGELNAERTQRKESPVEVVVAKPVFKDFNADIRARKLLELRQLEHRDISQPKHLSQLHPLSEALKKLLYEKNYRQLGGREKVKELQESFVVRELDGLKARFSIRELALINNQQKLLQLLDQSRKEEKIAIPSMPAKEKEKPFGQVPEQPGQPEQQEIKGEGGKEKAMVAADRPPLRQAVAVKKDSGDQQLEKAYFKTIDQLQKQIRGQEAFSELYKRLDMYRNYPHLNEEEIDTYLGLQQRLSGGLQQQLSVTKGKGRGLNGAGVQVD